MTRHLQREIVNLKKMILELSTKVDEMVYSALKAVRERRVDLSLAVIEADREIDQFEVEIEEECLKVLALHQPVAIDLRYLVAVLKINNDLERIGDLAVNIAKRARDLSAMPKIDSPVDFAVITEQTKQILEKSLEALVEMDVKVARQVLAADDEIDDLHRDLFRQIQDSIRDDPNHLEILIQYLSVSRNLERIADHATNIAEDVIYMIEGEIVRHGLNDRSSITQSK